MRDFKSPLIIKGVLKMKDLKDMTREELEGLRSDIDDELIRHDERDENIEEMEDCFKRIAEIMEEHDMGFHFGENMNVNYSHYPKQLKVEYSKDGITMSLTEDRIKKIAWLENMANNPY